jgi:hypothetical protein
MGGGFPGDSVDEEIQSLTKGKFLEAFLFVSGFSLIVSMEWVRHVTHSPRPGR